MNKPLKKILRSYHRLGYQPVVKRAPKDAVRFDRMIVVFFKLKGMTERDIFVVLLYDTKTETIVGQIQ